ncbi:ph-response sensor protein [Cadophora gregata]|uniref:ph-response sensor protein n=1 Tax=Cadophora gregata TaxID=51156 RepID=UPI0026DC6E08|nr:ph-response sensor protein [Cadophora gregata]KAK0119167.1 ph-response sensor protein [Cadophora gregata f. sp. sojae]KAK0126425.1 ph-response sensor protein [Cadophora gregata]
MCANVTPTTSVSPLPSNGRSFLSRLTAPLKSRTRNLTEFHIRPDEPHRKYSPGDLVRGAVVLTVVKPIRLTHLTVCLHGFVRVFKSPNGANDPLPDLGLTASSNPRKSQYFGNGHASLFQDEVTLCGEGRLDIGVYEFNFELEFPRKGLPSSVDFERGTISYLITATITRPTSITATSSCDQKLSLVETVDIGPMVPPKPQKISLEPISRRVRRRKTIKNKENGSPETTETGTGSGSEAARAVTSPLPDDSASQCGSVDHQVTSPRSPVPSEIQSTGSAGNSAESTVSSSTGLSFRLGAVPSSAKSTKDSPRNSSKVSLSDQTITATIELLKSGVLPGDNLPLKISIKHTKPLKSMHGIIITFYRQGRIDSAPPLSLFADIKGKDAERLKHEEYYPKSKTGLGGLSLSSAGSSSMFRKDLAQTFAPILVDPTSLTAVVNVSVRVPEDVFPTISGVPGQMIAFRYHVEVVVDLGGKLAGQQRHVPRLGAVALPSSFGASAGARSGEVNPNMLAAWGGSIVDTANIRREKSVVECRFEVVVGTKDTARKRARGNSSVRRLISDWSDEMSVVPAPTHEPIYEESVATNDEQYNNQQYRDPYPYYDRPPEHPHPDHQHPEDFATEEYDYQDHYQPPNHAQIHVPPPEIQADEGLSEKERLRRAEERLLPSQPPGDENAPSSSRTVIPSIAPSVPPGELEEDLYGPDDATPQEAPRAFLPPSTSTPLDIPAGPSAPAPEDLNPAAGQLPTEDKQELERRRLIAEASAPSEFPADEEDNAGEGSSRPQHEPSAPPMLEEDEYGPQYAHHNLPESSTHREALPKYER